MQLVFSTHGWLTFRPSWLSFFIRTFGQILSHLFTQCLFPDMFYLAIYCYIVSYLILNTYTRSLLHIILLYDKQYNMLCQLLYPAFRSYRYDMIGGWTQQDGSSWGNACHHTKRSGNWIEKEMFRKGCRDKTIFVLWQQQEWSNFLLQLLERVTRVGADMLAGLEDLQLRLMVHPKKPQLMMPQKKLKISR